MRNIAKALAAASVLVLVTPGCGSKVQQCNELITEINAAQTAIAGAGTSFSDKEKAKKIHDEIEAEIKKIEGVKISDEKLKEHQKKWVDQLTNFNKKMESISAAVEKGDAGELQKISKEITEVTNEVSGLVDETNKYCQGG